MKLIIICACCFLIIFISYGVYKYYKSRQIFFENILDFCLYAQTQINFLKKNICEIVQEKSDCYNAEFSSVLKNYYEILKAKNSFKSTFLKKLEKTTILKNEEKETIVDFFEMLGRSSCEEQCKQIENYKYLFLQMQKKSKFENEKYGAISVKLGLLFASCVFVIFI